MVISTSYVSQIIAQSDDGIPAGQHGICAEYLKFSNVKIYALLAICF